MKIEIGDVFELNTKNGKFIYLQCVNIPQDKLNEIELIKVYYEIYSNKQTDLISVTQKGHFFIRFPLSHALKKKIINKVGNLNLPINFKIPIYFRTENPFGKGWQIINSSTLKRENVMQLSEEQKKLSPFGFMNDTLIIELLEKGWNLDNWDLNNRKSQ